MSGCPSSSASGSLLNQLWINRHPAIVKEYEFPFQFNKLPRRIARSLYAFSSFPIINILVYSYLGVYKILTTRFPRPSTMWYTLVEIWKCSGDSEYIRSEFDWIAPEFCTIQWGFSEVSDIIRKSYEFLPNCCRVFWISAIISYDFRIMSEFCWNLTESPPNCTKLGRNSVKFGLNIVRISTALSDFD